MALTVQQCAACCLALLVALLTIVSSGADAAKVETFNPASCNGAATNTFLVGRNQCQTFFGEGAVRISGIGQHVRVSVHNQKNCEGSSSVAQIYGPGCVVQGHTKLQAVYVA